MGNPALHILLVEDKSTDYLMIKDLLSLAPRSNISMHWVRSWDSAVQEIRLKHFDACLVASSIAGGDDQGIMRRVQATGQSVPVIFLTRQENGEVDVRAIQAGAADILVKDQITPETLERTIRYAIERKRAEEALRRSEAQLKRLSSKLLLVHETERKRLALELHDSLGQILSAVKFGVESSLVHMERGTIKPSALEPLVPMIQHAIAEVRRIYTALRPTLLDDLGIVATLEWYCREFGALHPSLDVVKRIEIEEAAVPEPLKIVIYRLVQDGLDNVFAHSRATRVRVSLVETDAGIELSIEDNGMGLQADPIDSLPERRTGLGLPSMKERTELSGGFFRIESFPGKGAILAAVWPRS